MYKKAFYIAALGAVAILLVQGAALFFFGHPAICECGYVKFWAGVVASSETSQQISDWYTFSHIIHGFIFYLVLRMLFPRMPRQYRFLLALGLEAGWEIAENTPWVINQYRQQALARGYTGDSILNSLMDTCAMMLGFVMAWRLPVRVTVLLAIGMELFVGWEIRDNLTLNVLNFIHRFEFIEHWQNGG
jgi:Protein of unknown function (DUF2585)